MKKSIYIIGIALGLLSSACSDWLTVQPESTVVAENLFTSNDGVEQALNGAYVLMRTRLYAPEGVMGGTGLAECLAATWTQSGNTDYSLSAHVYDINDTGMAQALEMAFGEFYKIIANVNPLIDGIVENRALLDTAVYNIVRGEALAIRACMHLDLIRLWGPMPTKVDAGKAYLPYVTVNSTDKYTYSSYEEYMTKLFTDLDEAERLLRNSDPIRTYPADNNSTTGGTKWLRRQSHFNYYGVLGLQARAHLWYGDKEEAVRYAKLVKEAENEDGTPKFKLADNALFASFTDGYWDGLFYPEHLCGVHAELYNYDLGAFGGSMKVSMINMVYPFMELFDNNTGDLRYSKLWYTYTRPYQAVYCIKYQGVSPKTYGPKNMPIVRLAEMYLAIMECGTLAEANAAWQEFCTARNITYVPYTEEDRHERVLKEYIREFMAEGQNFFTYKRNEVKQMFNQPEKTLDCDVDQYVLPIPPKEF